MRLPLVLHPNSHFSAASRIEVDVTQPHANRLELLYVVTGSMEKICMPPLMAGTRCAELWRHTCFEAFVGASSDTAYYEFNFAPSTQWAAYWFADYRRGMRVADEISAPPIDVRASGDSFTLQVSIELDRMSGLSRKTSWRLGLSALIEDTNGRMSYWGLAHSPGKPDFHRTNCLAHEFSPN